MANHKKQLCPNRHDTNIVGRLNGQCRECRKNYQRLYNQRPEQKLAVKKWSNANKDHRKNTAYQRIYGITLADYQQMYKEQEGICPICSKWFTTLVVEHDHETGRIRGLTCSTCNRAMGLLKDDPKLLRSAASYLEKFSRFPTEESRQNGLATMLP